jgi:solute carrier family 25 (adenine nucleotide translocator) protein 4/5/6/31
VRKGGGFAGEMGKGEGSFMLDMALGGVSGAIVKTAMAPVERVKLLLQTQDSNPKVISGEIPKYTGIGDCFKRVSAEQGASAFWRGNLVNCIRYAPQQGSALAFNDQIKRMVPKYNPKTDYAKDFAMKLIAGGVAGGAANIVCYPFDFARTRLASDLGKGQGQFNGIADCIQKTVATGGITGLYRGSAITVAGAFVYRGGQLGLFAQIQDMNPYKSDKGMIGIVAAFVCATVARTITTPFNYPFDTIRRRMMLDSDKPAEERMYKSAIDCMMKVSKNEGLGGVYKGLVPELFRGLGGPLVLTAYDRIKLILLG